MKFIPLTNQKVEDSAATANSKSKTSHEARTCACPCHEGSLAVTPAIAVSGLRSISYDQKDVKLNYRNLLDSFEEASIAELNSCSPFCLNFAADGFPRIDGQPWGLTRGGEPSEFDPSDPATLPSFGQVIMSKDERISSMDASLPILGFFLRLRSFDNDLGSSAVKINIYGKDFEDNILSGTYELVGNYAAMFIPHFAVATTNRVTPINATTATSGQTLKFDAILTPRDQSYLVATSDAVEDAVVMPNSFFTITGHNVYCYVEPVILTKEMLTLCENVLTSNPSDYLVSVLAAVNNR